MTQVSTGSARREAHIDGEKLADIAHELRSPLGGIEAMIDLLDESALDAGQSRLVDALRASAKHLRLVANELIDPGQPAGVRDETLGRLLEHFVPSAEARAHQNGLGFVLNLGPACAQAVLTDGTGLRQVLENLIDNAMRLTVRGSVELRIKPELDGAGEAQLRFEVLDEGPGLTPDQTRVIFGRRKTLADRSAGAGLGLAIVARLVRGMNGDCGALARQDRQGACLWFTLPVKDFGTGAERLPGPATTAGVLAKQRPRLLVVDDHSGNRLVLQAILDHLGCDVTLTGSPRQALALAAAGGFAALITDMSMPEMDGCALVGALRRMAGPAGQMPVICVSGRVSQEEKDRLLASGGQVFVEKPVSIAPLRAALCGLGLIAG